MAKAIINISTIHSNRFTIDVTDIYDSVKSREELLNIIINKRVKTDTGYSRILITDVETDRTAIFPLSAVDHIELEGVILETNEKSGLLRTDNIEIFPIGG